MGAMFTLGWINSLSLVAVFRFHLNYTACLPLVANVGTAATRLFRVGSTHAH